MGAEAIVAPNEITMGLAQSFRSSFGLRRSRGGAGSLPECVMLSHERLADKPVVRK